jgi:hypothetical protein
MATNLWTAIRYEVTTPWLVGHAYFNHVSKYGPSSLLMSVVKTFTFIRGPFAKSGDSPYYSESELGGGAVTVSFSKYLPWKAIHFLQLSTHFSKTCCRPLINLKILASEFPFHGWKNPEIAWGEI